FVTAGVKKISACDEWKVFAVNQVARRQVQRGQMPGVVADFTGIKLGKQAGVRKRTTRQMFFSRISAHGKSAAAAGRVKHHGVGAANAKGIDDINDFWLGVVLSP